MRICRKLFPYRSAKQRLTRDDPISEKWAKLCTTLLIQIDIILSLPMHTGNRALPKMPLERYDLSSSIEESELERLP